MTKIAINGFGRIGRAAFKIALNNKKVKVVAINDLTDAKTLAYLLKYDSVYGRYEKKVTSGDGYIKVGSVKYPVFSQADPSGLPWKKLGVDVVLECTGVFKTAPEMNKHLKAGSKKVILSSPAKDESQTLVFGTELTEKVLKNNDQKMVSNASCTTNCISPVMQVLESKFGIEKAILTTIHAYTATQKITDSPDSKDWRRGRAGAVNLVPSTTGAAKATTKVVPSLVEKFDGIAIRVPVPCGSLSDITVLLKKDVTVEQINQALKTASRKPMFKGIIGVTEDGDELVSTDIIKTSYSTVVDLSFTKVVGGNLIKILAWYDNEWGYSCRLIDMAISI